MLVTFCVARREQEWWLTRESVRCENLSCRSCGTDEPVGPRPLLTVNIVLSRPSGVEIE
jgi:hypothetical protein